MHALQWNANATFNLFASGVSVVCLHARVGDVGTDHYKKYFDNIYSRCCKLYYMFFLKMIIKCCFRFTIYMNV